MLKKITMASLLLTGSLFGDTYIGVDLGYVKNDTTKETDSIINHDRDFSNDYTDIAILLGGGENGGVKLQGRLSYISYDEKIFFNDSSDSSIELGGDFLKEFAVGSNLYPYIKAGGGFDYMKLDSSASNASDILGFEINGGVGINYMPTNVIGIVFGVDYIYKKWEDLEADNEDIYTLSAHDSGFKTYLGLRYNF